MGVEEEPRLPIFWRGGRDQVLRFWKRGGGTHNCRCLTAKEDSLTIFFKKCFYSKKDLKGKKGAERMAENVWRVQRSKCRGRERVLSNL